MIEINKKLIPLNIINKKATKSIKYLSKVQLRDLKKAYRDKESQIMPIELINGIFAPWKPIPIWLKKLMDIYGDKIVTNNEKFDIICPKCNSLMEFVKEYNDYYCWICEEYLEYL